MNYKKVLEKVFIGALTGAVSAAAAIQPTEGEQYLRVLVGALVSGGVLGAMNAVKHRRE